ncbi:MBL fold metallo-hydrolase [Alcanivorax sp. 1008]|uniref:MBL fold metallo-hydrolase n=1 Tax=Alcanivorax sp. 1008 TaxID=2816853 RepID=UPI001D329293|nr:MBL fold metallo-hydrolase [Alcanivorax sp. 1008]MCC1496093.1 MBL fold metallo-hydrolase [Alcanivorax sp. 1008]
MPQETEKSKPAGAVYSHGKFRNIQKTQVISAKKLRRMAESFLTEKSRHSFPKIEMPIKKIGTADIVEAANNTMWRLCHSTLLLKVSNQVFLTDPVFCDRASPSQKFGPKRFHPNPINIDELPAIDGVLLSHDHYDHLDKAAILKLSNKVTRFYTPLKLGDLLMHWGVPESKIEQLDWWESIYAGNIKLTCTPAQHYSGRGIFDSQKRLWSSWAVETPDVNLFFSGDSGYFDGFKEIGERLGPFDITFIETGAYNKAWQDIHMLPEDSIQAHLDLKGCHFYPIHNATFDLAFHAWFDPFRRITTLADENHVKLVTPMIGQAISLMAPKADNLWWQELKV